MFDSRCMRLLTCPPCLMQIRSMCVHQKQRTSAKSFTISHHSHHIQFIAMNPNSNNHRQVTSSQMNGSNAVNDPRQTGQYDSHLSPTADTQDWASNTFIQGQANFPGMAPQPFANLLGLYDQESYYTPAPGVLPNLSTQPLPYNSQPMETTSSTFGRNDFINANDPLTFYPGPVFNQGPYWVPNGTSQPQYPWSTIESLSQAPNYVATAAEIPDIAHGNFLSNGNGLMYPIQNVASPNPSAALAPSSFQGSHMYQQADEQPGNIDVSHTRSIARTYRYTSRGPQYQDNSVDNTYLQESLQTSRHFPANAQITTGTQTESGETLLTDDPSVPCNGNETKTPGPSDGPVPRKKAKKRHVCRTCSMSFKRPSNLITHGNVHTGEKPFACQYCGRKFPTVSNKNRHEKLHRPDSGSKFAIRPPQDDNEGGADGEASTGPTRQSS